jgi:hypothetical protein
VVTLLVAVSLLSANAPMEELRCTGIRSPLRVRVTVSSRTFAHAASVMRATVEDVWGREGLSVAWIDADPPDRRTDVDFWIAAAEGMTLTGGVIGTLLFHDDTPRSLAQISIDAAIEWVRRYEESRFLVPVASRALLQMPDAIHLIERTLGYAAAHELGHFVLASKSHTSSGVMQDVYRRPGDLKKPSIWQLDAGSRARLQRRLAAGTRCAEGAVTQSK